jgi:hypothetical protein
MHTVEASCDEAGDEEAAFEEGGVYEAASEGNEA